MNKIVKIHLILATIFSISCNSWSTNPNGNINKIDYYYDLNKNNSYKNISRTTYVNVAKRMSYEQCQTIFNEKYTQLQNEINTAHSAFFAAFKEFYNANDADLFSAITSIPAADSPTGNAITVTGAKFYPENATTYVFRYQNTTGEFQYKIIKVVAGS